VVSTVRGGDEGDLGAHGAGGGGRDPGTCETARGPGPVRGAGAAGGGDSAHGLTPSVCRKCGPRGRGTRWVGEVCAGGRGEGDGSLNVGERVVGAGSRRAWRGRTRRGNGANRSARTAGRARAHDSGGTPAVGWFENLYPVFAMLSIAWTPNLRSSS